MPLEPDAPRFRLAERADAGAIADLHARSWRAAYRGAMSDAYLDGPVFAERRFFWTERFAHPSPDLLTLVAEQDGAGLAGFACALLKHDARWGTLIDNLHADPALKRRGIGRAMMRELARHLIQRAPSVPVHLFVLRANTAAAAFYAALGGETVEHMIKTEPDGTPLPVERVAWESVVAFARAVG